jgi:hypothetical protein
VFDENLLHVYCLVIMEIIPVDTPHARDLVYKLVEERGRTPEHNADWFLCMAEGDGRKPVLALLDEKRAVLAYDEGDKWTVLEEPLTPTEEVASTLRDFSSELFERGMVKKVVLELKTEVRQELLHELPSTLKAHSINYTMSWPVYDLKAFDSSLPGKKWKSMRNAKNAFYREHRVEVVEARVADQQELHALVDGWGAKRTASNRTYAGRYHAIIDAHFKGFESARAMIVDGKVAGINGGWPFPHKPGYFYASVGLHDYAFKDIGAMLYLEDLAWIKERGYDYADMAGGEDDLNHFKNQFHPAYWYKTHVFSLSPAQVPAAVAL